MILTNLSPTIKSLNLDTFEFETTSDCISKYIKHKTHTDSSFSHVEIKHVSLLHLILEAAKRNENALLLYRFSDYSDGNPCAIFDKTTNVMYIFKSQNTGYSSMICRNDKYKLYSFENIHITYCSGVDDVYTTPPTTTNEATWLDLKIAQLINQSQIETPIAQNQNIEQLMLKHR